MISELLLVSGRSGVGKSSAAFALHDLLAAEGIKHAVIEGDALGLAWPEPWEHRLAARNLAAVWANYRDLGYRRLIYTNTVAILEADEIAAAMGDQPHVTSVLLTASDGTVQSRLSRREDGESLRTHIERSATAAAILDERSSANVHRVSTDDRTTSDVAASLRSLWID
ncbi:ATPase [Isoptericola croceus]|uniref:ATPase n=1 Tax=Isoptericola croceus TaxID=3031406 RepID=UPI0023F91B51|nr:ATPase [Isoptericola croceus]